MRTNEYLKNYYENYDENGRLASKHGMIEFITTMKFIEKYLKPDMRVLEIGAATGRYSHTIARKGYQVDAVELVEHNIGIFKENTAPGEQVTITQGSATDLSAFESNTYDITLLLGPMYHLYTEEEQRQALSEAIRVTKKGGIVFAAYCMAEPSILRYGFMQGNIPALIADGLLDGENFRAYTCPAALFALHRTEDIDALRSHFNVTQLHYVAADGYTNHMRETVDAMDDKNYEIYIRYHLTVCERRDLIGFSHHTLDIFRKE